MLKFALFLSLPLSAQILAPSYPSGQLPSLPLGTTLTPEAHRTIAGAMNFADARPILPVSEPEIADMDAVRRSWVGVDFSIPREGAKRANETLFWFEPLKIPETDCRDEWLSICASAQRSRLPMEFAVCRYLEWLTGIIDSRVQALTGRSARFPVDSEFGVGAERALRAWQAWASNLHTRAKTEMERYSVSAERAQRKARNAERIRKQNEIASLR